MVGVVRPAGSNLGGLIMMSIQIAINYPTSKLCLAKVQDHMSRNEEIRLLSSIGVLIFSLISAVAYIKIGLACVGHTIASKPQMARSDYQNIGPTSKN